MKRPKYPIFENIKSTRATADLMNSLSQLFHRQPIGVEAFGIALHADDILRADFCHICCGHYNYCQCAHLDKWAILRRAGLA